VFSSNGRGGPVTSRPRTVPRLALSKTEAAESLGCSVDHLERHVLEHLRVVYVGARRLIPVAELERYLREQAVPVLPVVETGGCQEVAANGGVRARRGPVLGGGG
jgi:excisionase family DNA binding protein